MSIPARIPRRTALKGLGTAISLPLLEAMLPKGVQADDIAIKPPVRMGIIFYPNGVVMSDWTPETTGSDYPLPPTLEPLAGLKNDLTIFTGLAQKNARALGDGAGDHARCASTFLTGVHPYKTAGADIRAGVSVDQVAAEMVGHLTTLPSLELGTERGRTAGDCDSGYSCAYSSCVSWKSPSTPMAKEIKPKLAFERLFGLGGGGADRDRRRRALYRRSILDLVTDDARRLAADLGANDRHKLDEYMTSVREIEARIDRAPTGPDRDVPEFDVPDGVPQDYQQHVRLMYDVMALAFQADVTRIATFMLANAATSRPYPMIGVNDGHHPLSHHQQDAEKIEKLKKIDRFHVTEFARFLDRLKSTPEGQGTLLDNCMLLYGSAISDGNAHAHHDLPILFAGSGGGTIQPGRHIKVESETPLNNLFLSMLDGMGASVDELGDSTGRLKGLQG